MSSWIGNPGKPPYGARLWVNRMKIRNKTNTIFRISLFAVCSCFSLLGIPSLQSAVKRLTSSTLRRKQNCLPRLFRDGGHSKCSWEQNFLFIVEEGSRGVFPYTCSSSSSSSSSETDRRTYRQQSPCVRACVRDLDSILSLSLGWNGHYEFHDVPNYHQFIPATFQVVHRSWINWTTFEYSLK